jgi:ATP-binding cassette subfamily C protein LapB
MDKDKKKYNRINRTPIRFIPIMLLVYLSINLLSLTLPLAMKKIYGSIMLSRSLASLRYVLIGVLIAIFLESIMKKIKDSSTKWISAKYEYKLSIFLMNKLMHSYTHNSNDENYITNLEKFNSISRITTFHSTRMYQLFIDLPFMCIFLYLIYIFGGPLVLIPIVLSAIYVIVLLIISHKYFKNRMAQIKANDKLVDQLTETLEKIHLVKGAGIEESQIIRYRKLLDEATESSYISDKYESIPRTLSSNFAQLNLFTILIGGGFLISTNSITFAEITACAMLGGRAIGPVVSIMNQYFQRKDIQILKNRIDEISDIKSQYSSDVPDFPEDISGNIEIINLEYEDIQTHKKEILNATIEAGSFVHISPRSFLSYKTILRKMIGQEKIKSGQVLIDNLDIKEWNMNSLKGKIEYICEHVSIYKGSIIDNITYFNDAKIQNAYNASAITGLDEMISHQANGFETQIDDYSRNSLSPAFIQRLNLTRALIDRPRILILDRIDESMDVETLANFKWLLERFRGRMTIILVSDNPELVKLSDSKIDGFEESAII